MSSNSSRHSKSHKKHSKKHETSSSSSSDTEYIEKYESKSSSDSESPKECSFEEVYKFYKWKLLHDEHLMVGGSSAYGSAVANQDLSIPVNAPIYFNQDIISKNIDHPFINSPFFVRESGVYLLYCITNSNESVQYSVYVNGDLVPNSTVGNNSGGGQLIIRQLVNLNKDDSVLVRNYISGSNITTISVSVGGLIQGINSSIELIKLAPPVCELIKDRDFNEKCVSHKMRNLFKKLKEKLICDKELMMKGFNTHGTFYSKQSQVVNVEAPVLFDTVSNVENLTFNLTNGEIKIVESGVYKVSFLTGTATSAQFTFFVNGVPLDYTTEGLNKGASQLSISNLVTLNKNDVVTVVNHTSAQPITIPSYTGGSLPGISMEIGVIKIAPLPNMCDYDKTCNWRHYEKYYEKFREYLLSKCYLQIDGSPSYIDAVTLVTQSVPVNSAFNWSYNKVDYQLYHKSGTETITVKHSGVYDLFVDVITNEPSELCLFINGTADLTAISGRDSGGNRCVLRQLVKLNCGDVLSVRNYKSILGTITTALNPGGNAIGYNSNFMLFKLSNC